ncbi:EcoKI restriction-modification system protein HsdS [Pseudovibrio sp. Ad46]|uniref:restriction endonuclease subunit S n=1 Tax=Pseudovibrio sp. Ad46 TaxID=989432 RepID=UPI0007AE8077|nr:restriction endonuclease subunit S [Pseudovibrio sp. Ad46]KZK77499.1 EcoKI restriction-modification system protein HsdS [Pseudovibrio sp. Ad46]
MAGKYKAYPEYKKSGVEWLGEIPSEWELKQIKHLSVVKRGASPRPIDDPKYFDDEGEYAWTRIADVTASDVYLLSAPQRLSKLGSSLSVKLAPNELFLSIAGSVGKPCITGMNACIHDGFVYFPELEIPSKFLFYIFAGGQAYKGLGKMGTQLNLNTDTVGAIKVGLPTPEEIEQIIDFLDHETAKIDRLIERQERLIGLLEEKRQAVISHAVTKGLNPDAPLRPSGVDWLGDVPEHWEALPLKYLCNLIKDGTHLPPPRVDVGVPLLSVRNIINGKFRFLNDDSHISREAYQALCRSFIPQADDVLLAIVGATLGKSALVTKMSNFHIQRSVAIFRTNADRIHSEFLLYAFRSTNFQELLWQNVGFSAQPGIYLGALENFKIPTLLLSEQREIIEHCKTQDHVFLNLISKAQAAIDLLKERRTALISAAVTGKIDVREWVPSKDGFQPAEESASLTRVSA